ncbi:MAG: hypothetical protein ABJG15_07525 [Hyphomonadaceae bacterium]
MTLKEIVDFAETDDDLSNRKIVELIVYFFTEVEGVEVCTSGSVRSAFNELDLPTPSRVSSYLTEGATQKYRQYVRKGNGYTLHRVKRQELTKKFEAASGTKEPEISFEILSTDDVSASRKYIRSIIRQINGTYTYGFYDATAVLMRRLMESLLIEAFVASCKDHVIRDANGKFLSLNGVLNQAKNPANLTFSRGQDKVMDSIKDIGDAAAHNRNYVTRKADIDHLQIKYRRLTSELYKLAGF